MQVEINVELTAEEWRRRYDRLKEAHGKLRKMVDGYVDHVHRSHDQVALSHAL